MSWLWCYQRLRPGDGKMVENRFPLGLVTEIGDEEAAAWRRVGELCLVEKYITLTPLRFDVDLLLELVDLLEQLAPASPKSYLKEIDE